MEYVKLDYETLKENASGKCPMTAETKDGEYMIITEGEDGDTHFFETQTAQNNNWIRKKIYWEDGTEEELWER